MKFNVIVIGSIMFLANVAAYFVGVWFAASLLTSGIKTSNVDCGVDYQIESYGVDGDLFCE